MAAVNAAERNNFFAEGSFWSDFFRISGYVPGISSTTGYLRAGIGALGAIINAVCIPIFSAINEEQLAKQAVENLKSSASWVVRGFVEAQPFVGNAAAWSWDSLNSRLNGARYSKGILYDWRFVPILSLLTGGLRATRGAIGSCTGLISELFYNTIKSFDNPLHIEHIDDKIAISHKFAKESALEIPEGIIEMIPLCDGFCPPLATLADKIEQKKMELWTPPHQE